ncbi:MAG TPA: molybdate ABC transporter permease subunit [Gammaproteobacteria bacterium]|nr:MAG: molybdate ABC transporter permease subunit [Gammaproteobacteria bacterium TMED134]RPG46860.1 MAG: molybdate ABC transporter permease subunit [Gammaproteobacteria bacterium TMED134]RZO72734.1 MAG: molybdate ABC transporter permease subunit [OM182 bacterium]HAL42559.1 molybdate ABC transporter permease subunit [Gammaproteobacteria bacterium]HBK17043.1 molybdate ABC transporter permease subunit [Gammaproteobacteria bacterium]
MSELPAIWLSLELALITTALLAILATPLAWWLAHTSHPLRPVIEAITALPLVMPPTVIGFYLLLLFSPSNPLGSAWLTVTDTTLAFSFHGLVIASMVYSLPFMVQPLTHAFSQMGKGPIEAATLLGAGPMDTFWNIVLPLARGGYLTALVLTFAHTLGEFGIVLMVGGNIPGETRVISIAIYEQVETLNYDQAHFLSGLLLAFSFIVLILVYTLNRRSPLRLS